MLCRYLRYLLKKKKNKKQKKKHPSFDWSIEGIKMGRGKEFVLSKVTSFEGIVSAILALIVGKTIWAMGTYY